MRHLNARRRELLTLVMGLLLLLVCPALASAATITPNITTDEYDSVTADTDCSLREAVQAANTDGDFGGCTASSDDLADTIVLDSGSTYALSLPGAENSNATGDLDVLSEPLTIEASGAGLATIDSTITDGDGVIDTAQSLDLTNLGITTTGTGTATDWAINQSNGVLAVNDSRVFGNSGGAMRLDGISTTVNQSTIGSNTADTIAGIFHEIGTVDINRSTFSGNHSGASNAGGALATNNSFPTAGAVTVTNSTFSDNSAEDGGGAISTQGKLDLRSTTIAGNTADSDADGSGDGGGISGSGGSTINARNSIIANNVDASATGNVYPDCAGTLTSQGYNLIEDTSGCTFTPNNDRTAMDPLLGPLAPNGGPTLTRALLAGSPAINAGNPATPGGAGNACPATDQRGFTRVGTVEPCDIGAFEVQDGDGDGVLDNSDNCPAQSGPASNGGCPLPASTAPPTGVAPFAPFNLKAAIKKCKKKFPKGPKRKKCIKKAKRRARS